MENYISVKISMKFSREKNIDEILPHQVWGYTATNMWLCPCCNLIRAFKKLKSAEERSLSYYIKIPVLAPQHGGETVSIDMERSFTLRSVR